jgi:23S rRNA pseudouridine1911/1915/1917 synthase
LAPEQIDLPTLYEDEYLWIINKPAGMVVHPGPGHPSGTVLNALLSKIGPLPKTDAPQTAPGDAGEGNGDADEEIGEATRAWPGLVHRLDRFTSGCLAMAKDEDTKTRLQAQFKARTVEKTYLALARQSRRLPELGSLLVNAPLARHRIDRTKMVINSKGKEAQTKVKVLARANGLALVSCDILTGRTHQIRVHLSSLGAPLLGDPLYGGATAWKGLDGGQLECPHPALHSWKLALSHPNGERIKATAEIPKALECLLAALGMDLADG